MFVVQGKNVVRCRKVPPVPMLPEKPPDNTVEPEEQFRTKVYLSGPNRKFSLTRSDRFRKWPVFS